jgi:hypothetical protein
MPSHDQRDAYLRDCAARFARDLETILKRDPLQWYNFYSFWEEPARGTNWNADSLDRAEAGAATGLADSTLRAPLSPSDAAASRR